MVDIKVPAGTMSPTQWGKRGHRECSVVYTSMEFVYGIGYMGLGRDPLSDPEQFESYGPSAWWASAFYSGRMQAGRFMPRWIRARPRIPPQRATMRFIARTLRRTC